METKNKYRVLQCFKCPGDTEYFCVNCQWDLCSNCKERHLSNLEKIEHSVLSFRELFHHLKNQNIIDRLSQNKSLFSENREISVSRLNSDHETYDQLELTTVNETSPQQHRTEVCFIAEHMLYKTCLLTGIKADIKSCRNEFSLHESNLLNKAQNLKDRLCNVLRDVEINHGCLKQKREMHRYISDLENYEHLYDYLASKPVSALFTIKPFIVQNKFRQHHRIYLAESIRKMDMIIFLSRFQLLERGKRLVKYECLLKLMSEAKLQRFFTVSDITYCRHISCATSDQIWVSEGKNIFMTSRAGAILYRLSDLDENNSYGSHTMTRAGELLYVDNKYTIKKLSKNPIKIETYMKVDGVTRSAMKNPPCLFCSPLTGDLLIGFDKKVNRYNKIGELIHTIQHLHNTGMSKYGTLRYITENNNGDVIVSAFNDYHSTSSGAVIVSESGGEHRFSYRGHPSGKGLLPTGICTDVLSHILVCDDKNKTVHMLDRNGLFLSYLLIESEDVEEPHSLCYDFNTHRIFVGSGISNKVCVYRYITRHGSEIGKTDYCFTKHIHYALCLSDFCHRY